MAKKRKPLAKGKRFSIFERDAFTCQYCGRKPPTVVLQVDHILAVAQGGDNEDHNLITSCVDCNSGKSARTLTAEPADTKARLEREIESRQQLEAYNEFLMSHRATVDKWVQELGFYWHNKFRKEQDAYVFGGEREPSIRRFVSQMPMAKIMEAMDIAQSRFPIYGARDDSEKTWKYFCGICWRMIRESEGDDA